MYKSHPPVIFGYSETAEDCPEKAFDFFPLWKGQSAVCATLNDLSPSSHRGRRNLIYITTYVEFVFSFFRDDWVHGGTINILGLFANLEKNGGYDI